ncbi:MAG: DUF1667 domain-containing protein [Oscillospiraceae bacterium]|nr:DUF1667 domain-containing protein [Oscillospiraceae bacterium]
MAVKSMTCLECPRGCQLEIDLETLNVTGNFCQRGDAFAKAEVTNPLRVLTSTVRIDSQTETMLPVRTEVGIPKAKLFDAMEHLKSVRVKAPVLVGDTIEEDFCGTGVRLIATKNVRA